MKVSHDLVLNFLYTCLSKTQQKKLIFLTYITTNFIRFQIISITNAICTKGTGF
eukprot:GAHX01010092.1.p1 GENE.GAHX01010092.1~~GAHX01010092.1.p1  ORF type:complete len:54 (+),score=1.58 GAHX01010092.1:50-211(+)